MTTKYFLQGPVRGNCGHKHRTITGAARCLARDAKECRGQGGYTDRDLCVIGEDGWRRPVTEGEDAAFAAAYDAAR